MLLGDNIHVVNLPTASRKEFISGDLKVSRVGNFNLWRSHFFTFPQRQLHRVRKLRNRNTPTKKGGIPEMFRPQSSVVISSFPGETLSTAVQIFCTCYALDDCTGKTLS